MIMKSRPIWLTVYAVVILSLLIMMNALNAMLQGSAYSKRLVLDGIDVNDMSVYYAMGEYYPPDNIDTLNVSWQGGRVEIIAYDNDEYFVEEAATRQLSDDERLSYSFEGNTFSVYFTADASVEIDDAYKKLEIRVPSSIAQNLKTVNVASNGEVVMRNITAESITVSTTEGEVRCGNVYSDSMTVQTVSGDVELSMAEGTGFELMLDSDKGKFKSDLELTGQDGKYTYADGTYKFSVITQSGDVSVL